MAITQVSLIPEAGRRGVDARDTFVTKQEAFQDSLNSSFIPQFNNMATDIQSMAEFSVFSNPVWEAKAYTADYSVNYNGNCYISTEATLATDVPSVSSKWKQTNASDSSADMQVFTTSGTWTKPAGVSMVRIILCGGGAGGGSGAKSGTTVEQVGLGGGAGGGGGVCDVTIPASLFSDTESVIIGAGGSGGVGVNTGTAINGYTGKPGTSGGSTTFGTFTVTGGYGGSGGLCGQGSSVTSGQGGNSYIADIPDAVYPTTNMYTTTYRRFFKGAQSTASYYNVSDTSKTYNTFYGGCTTRAILTLGSSPFIIQAPTPTSLFGGSAGGYGDGIYLANGTSTRTPIVGSTTFGVSATKFLPSYFGSYTSMGGVGAAASLTANGGAGTAGTGYGAGGGGGGGCTENYTAGNGGNGSSGIAIIISW